MKNLFSLHSYYKEPRFSREGQFVFIEQQAENVGGAESDSLIDKLDIPVKIGIREIRQMLELDESGQCLFVHELNTSPILKQKFERVVDYYLRLLETQSNQGSFLLIIQEIAGNKTLFNLLSQNIKDKVDGLLDDRLDFLSKLLETTESSQDSFEGLSDRDKWEMLSLYKYVRSCSKDNEKAQTLFSRVHAVLARFQYESFIAFSQQAEASDLWKAFSSQDRCLVAQVNHLLEDKELVKQVIPKEVSDAIGGNVVTARKAFLQNLLQSDILSDATDLSSVGVGYWHHLQAMVYDIHTVEPNILGSNLQKQVDSLVYLGQKIEFSEYINKNNTLSPEDIHILDYFNSKNASNRVNLEFFEYKIEQIKTSQHQFEEERDISEQSIKEAVVRRVDILNEASFLSDQDRTLCVDFQNTMSSAWDSNDIEPDVNTLWAKYKNQLTVDQVESGDMKDLIETKRDLNSKIEACTKDRHELEGLESFNEDVFSEKLDRYTIDIQKRIQGRHLSQDDFEVIFDSNAARLLGIAPEYANEMRRVRQSIVLTLKTKVAALGATFGATSDIDALAKDIERVLDVSEIMNNSGVDLTSIAPNHEYKERIHQEFVAAAVNTTKQEVLEVLQGNLGNSQFLELWARLRVHANTTKPGGLISLDEDVAWAQGEKEKLNRLLVHAKTCFDEEFSDKGYTSAEFIKQMEAFHEEFMQGKDVHGNFIDLGMYGLNHLQVISGRIVHHLDETLNNFIQSGEDAVSSEMEKDFVQTFIDVWEENKSFLHSQLKAFKQLFIEVFDGNEQNFPQSVRDYFDRIDTLLQHIEGGIRRGMGREEVLFALKGFKSIKNDIDLKSGTWAHIANEKETRFTGGQNKLYTHIDAIKVADKLGLVSDEGAIDPNPEFTSHWMDMQRETKAIFDNYSESFENVINALSLDIKKHNGDDTWFMRKYGKGYVEVQDMLQKYKDGFGVTKNMYDTYSDPKYLETWLADYRSGDSRKQFEQMEKLSQWEDFVNSSSELGKQSEALDSFFSKWKEGGGSFDAWWKEQLKKGAGKVKDFGGSVEFRRISLTSIYEAWNKFWDFRDTITKRRNEASTAWLGEQLTSGEISKEFAREGDRSEGERVQQLQDTFKDSEILDMKDELYECSSKDKAKALINILSEKGSITWRDPALWRVFDRLGSGVLFLNPEYLDIPYLKLQQKIEQAVVSIWDTGTYKTWMGAVDESRESSMKNYDAEFQNANPGAELKQMLTSWVDGDENEQVNRARYLSFLSLSLEQGKANGAPDKRFYYIIMGVSQTNDRGQSLLTDADIKFLYNKHMAIFPALEFFDDASSYRNEKGEIVKDKINKRSINEKVWTQSDYSHWADLIDPNKTLDPDSCKKGIEIFYHNYVFASSQARMRMGRMGQKSYDHDDAKVIIPGLDWKKVMTQLTTESTSNEKLTPDFWLGALAGWNEFLGMEKEIISSNDKIFGEDNPEWKKARAEKMEVITGVMKASMYGSQILVGNITAAQAGDGRSQQLTNEQYEKGTESAVGLPSGKASVKRLNHGFRDLLKRQGMGDSNDLFKEDVVAIVSQKDRGKPARNKIIIENYMKDSTLFSAKNVEDVLFENEWGGGSYSQK